MHTMMTATLRNDRIWIEFRYDEETVEILRNIPGAIYVPKSKGGPAFRFPKEYKVCQDLRKRFSKRHLLFSDELLEWGLAIKDRMVDLLSMANAKEGVDLQFLPDKLPGLYSSLRLDQRVGVKYIANCANPFVCDQPGLGKTRQIIGGVFEANMEMGPKLVIAPKATLDAVWLQQLNDLQDQPVFVADEGRKNRDKLMEELRLMAEMEEPFWLVLNPAMITLRRVKFEDDEAIFDPNRDEFEYQFPLLHETWWTTVIVDETTKCALANTQSLTAKGIRKLNSSKRIGADGTPVRGNPINVWGALNWLEPELFKSKHRWADQWVEVAVEEVQKRGTRRGDKNSTVTVKKFGQIKEGQEEAFYRAHGQFILRRTKAEILTSLPPKDYQDVWVEMSGKQAAQYKRMADEGAMRLAELEEELGTVSMTSVLAEYARLKQFAGSYCEVEYDPEDPRKLKVKPTTDSCKIPALMQILDDRGILDPEYDDFIDSEKEQVVIFSQFSSTVDMLHEYLNSKGIPTAKITGSVKRNDRKENQSKFQQGGHIRVMLMTTTVGVGIDLDRASTGVFWDETWVPDDQEQASDRLHRSSRIHQVTIITIRTKKSIEEDIQKGNRKKQKINDTILDIYRKKNEHG